MRGTWLAGAACAVLAGTAAPLVGQSRGAYLGDLTWPDAERRMREAPLVIVPFGAGAKEHGPHLPMNADAKVLDYLVRLAVDSLPVLAAPPILHGWFPAFRDFPGTEVADPDVFIKYVLDVARSLVQQGARRVVFLNTGIAAATGLPLSIVAREIRTSTGTPTLVVSWDDLETPEYHALERQQAGGHADEIETSISLYLQPQLVHMDRAVKDYGTAPAKDYPGYQPGQFSRDSLDPAFSRTGQLGDPTLASPEKGKQALEIMGRTWLKALRGFAQAPRRSGAGARQP
jgi:creatinine amidohydrolase